MEYHGTAQLLSRVHPAHIPHRCACGAYHLRPAQTADPTRRPHCRWCGWFTPAPHYLHCTRHHSAKRARANQRRGPRRRPCPNHPLKRAFDDRGTAVLIAGFETTDEEPIVWYLCDQCQLYHLTSDEDRRATVLEEGLPPAYWHAVALRRSYRGPLSAITRFGTNPIEHSDNPQPPETSLIRSARWRTQDNDGERNRDKHA
ncbi:hypothetical protein ACWDSJ_26235 [Nocardia sp. NPDC003482]